MKTRANNEVTLAFPSRSSNEGFARAAVSCFAAQMDPTLNELEDIKTAVSEACKNVACHGSSGFSTKYEIECNVDKGSIEIIVRDDCDCHTLEKTCKPCLNCPEEGDLGIIVIKTLMDDVEFGRDDSGHKFVKMGKKL